MANEGIMALPQGEAMPSEEAQNQQPTVTSAQSYDAAQTALGMVDPQGPAALKESIRQNIGDLQLTPGQLDLLIQIFEYVSQNPGDYANLVQQLIESGGLEEGDMPAEYDPEFIGVMLIVLNEMQQMQGAGAQEAMDLGPAIAGLQPMGMAQGGLADVGQYLAGKGRGGDSILAHITPEEAAMLKRRGGAGSINPATGLPEFKGNPLKAVFSAVKGVVKGVVNVVKGVAKSPIGRVLATVALATVLGPTAIGLSLGTAGTAALASGAVTLAGGGSIKDALVSGAMGYVGGGGTIMGTSPMAALGGYLPGAAGSALNTGLSTGLIGAGIGKLSGMSTQDALRMGLTSGASAAALAGLQNTSQAAPQPASAPGIGTAQDLLNAQAAGGDGTGLQLPPGAAPEPGYTVAGSPVPAAGAPVQAATDASAPLQLPPGAAPEPGYTVAGAKPGFFDQMTTGAKDLYSEYLSPSRPGLAADAGMFTKYAPLAAAGTAAIGLAGGMQGSPSNPNPAFNRSYTGSDYMRDNPAQFSGGLSTYTRPDIPANPIVPTPSYSSIPVGPPGMMTPSGITQQPGGVAQPYNMAGLYGIPLIYGPDGQPQRMAKGGDAKPTSFPRKNGPINGPGTGTSDDIPAMLSDGEFVFTAKAVRNAGSGSRRKGAARMYKLMKMLEGGPVKGK
jgi:hypothetical protein